MSGETGFIDNRDKRTDPILKSRNHKNSKVLIAVGSETGKTFPGQVMAITLANLLPRIFNHLGEISAQVILRPKLSLFNKTEFGEEFIQLVTSANPQATLYSNENTNSFDFVIGVGPDSQQMVSRMLDVIVDADGWICLINPRKGIKLAHCSKNIAGPVFSACLGLSELIKHSAGYSEQSLIRNRALSLLDYSILDIEKLEAEKINSNYKPLKFGKILMVGAGGVGSSVAYLLNILDASFEIDIVDIDTVSDNNLSTSPLFFFEQFDHKANKAVVLADRLNNGKNKTARSHAMKYSLFSKQNKRTSGQFDVVLPLADILNAENQIENARLQLQQGIYPFMIHGTTTPDWGINLHRHVPYMDDCIMCRFPSSRFNAKFSCGETIVVQDNNQQDHLALPFQPLAAATLVVVELIRMALGLPLSDFNKVYIDTKGSLEMISRSKELQKKDCGYHDTPVKIYSMLNDKSKYISLIPLD